MKKYIFLFIGIFLTACGQNAEVNEPFTWVSPGGTGFIFNIESGQEGSFDVDKMDEVLGLLCFNPLMVSSVEVNVTNAIGYNGSYPVDYEAGYGVTGTSRDASGEITQIKIFIAGGGFKILDQYGSYTYPARSGSVPTNAVQDMNGTIMEEVFHACQRTTNEEAPKEEDLRSEDLHREFLLKPVIFFMPDWR